MLVVDDSATVRALLVRILSDDPEIQVVGEASDGLEAIAMTAKLRPDLVTMDILMPRMDGLTATKEIMITTPTPIIMITASNRAREVEASLSTLRIGALDVLDKPPAPASVGFDAAARRIVATVKAMSQVKVIRHWRDSPAILPPPPTPFPAARKDIRGRIVAIGASTGGPAALQLLLAALPRDFAVPILIVQHITPGFTEGLASWLGSSSGLNIQVARHNEPLSPRTVYIAPDDQHLGISSKGTILLSDADPIAGFRPSATFLFDSVAASYGASTLAVILTGMGSDGLPGLRSVRQMGGHVIAQDEASCVIYGMPKSAIDAGLANQVLPIDLIAHRLTTLL